MTRNQFLISLAVIPFIGKLFKPEVYPKYQAFGKLHGSPFYTFYESPHYGETWADPISVQLGEPTVIKVQPDDDLQYLTGFKPGDKIIIEPGNGYQGGLYTIGKEWFLINDKTGDQASKTITHKNPEFATYDEMNHTHGISGFNWSPA